MKRLHQVILIASFLPLCWLVMMAVHELGHAAAGWLTGGTVTKVVLHPLAISRTDVSPNPEPTIVVWAGPMLGVMLPLLIWGAVSLARLPVSYLFRFFAGFCLIANGAYIGVGSLEGLGDAGEMLRHGSPSWCLWLFGLVAIPFGLALWHGQGRHFGLGKDSHSVDPTTAYVVSAAFLVALFAGFLLSPTI